MRRLICAVLVFVMGLGMASCNKVDINELKKIEGPMLEVERVPQGPMTEEEFEMYNTITTITYEGKISIPGNPVQMSAIDMKDEDYLTVYNFCTDAVKTDKFKDYKEDVVDGDIYIYTFYDENGTAHKFYEGYIYENKDLKKLNDAISNYSID